MTPPAGRSSRRVTGRSSPTSIGRQALDALAERARQGPITLVFGARDAEHNQARVIADELERRLGIVGGSPTPGPEPGDD